MLASAICKVSYLTSSQRREQIQRKEEAARQAVWGEAGAIIAELKLTVEALRKQLGQEQVARAQLEEDMKQAFMRGVCALNLEVSTRSCMCYICAIYHTPSLHVIAKLTEDATGIT